MNYTYGLYDKIIAYLTLISGLVISAVAVWYSVAGLVSIFAASAFSIIVMGVALEASKLVATVWLKWNWQRAPRMIKIYLISAISVLMLITSMGIFGYLSKAHLDQSLVSGDVIDKISLIDEKIKTQKDNIEASRKALRQMDEAVDQTMARSSDEKGADKAATLRRQQQRERTNLQNDISRAQAEIAKLNEERAPIAKEVRKVEAEVGPIKYIAKLIYGDNPDANILEKAVTWVIIIIVLVFDPLAVVLLLSSQYSFQWFKQQAEERKNELVQTNTASETSGTEISASLESDDRTTTQERPDELEKQENEPPDRSKEINESEIPQSEILKDIPFTEPSDKTLEDWNKMLSEAEKAAEEEKKSEEEAILESVHHEEKLAMQKWKQENPDGSLKIQRRLYDAGRIEELPWKKFIDESIQNDDAEEALKWAQEQLEDSKKKTMTWIEKEGKSQIKRVKED